VILTKNEHIGLFDAVEDFICGDVQVAGDLPENGLCRNFLKGIRFAETEVVFNLGDLL